MNTPLISTKKHLRRRAFLKGSGAVLALPWLDAMLPTFATRSQAAEATVAPQRFVAVNYGLGFHAPNFFPEQTGADYEPSLYLKLLEKHRRDFTVIQGLAHTEQNGQNGHASGMTWLTAAKHPGLPGFKNSISFDQLLVEKLRPDTRFPFFAISGSDRGLSWTSNGIQIPTERSPAALFARMFVAGTPQEVKQQVSELKRGRSVLDTVGAMAKRFQRDLGTRDREKMDQYFTAVRDLESRIQQSENWVHRPKPKVSAKPPQEIRDPNDIIAHQRQKFDLITLAFQTDSTRVVTCAAGGGGKVPTIKGVSEGHHPLSHHGRDPEKIAELTLIEKAEFGAINGFLDGLNRAADAHGSVLKNTNVLIGSNLGNASSHSWRDLPLILAGGQFRHGRHLVAGGSGFDNARFSNLFVQIARNMGVDIENFGSSNATTVKGLERAPA